MKQRVFIPKGRSRPWSRSLTHSGQNRYFPGHVKLNDFQRVEAVKGATKAGHGAVEGDVICDV